MIRTIVLDMGNVLVRFSHARMCRQIAALCGVGGEVASQLLFERGWQMELERGTMSDEEFALRLGTAVGCPIPIDELRFAASDIFEPMPGIPELLGDLKRAGHRLVLLSNTSRAHYDFITSRWDVLTHFDELVLSYKVGAMKPDTLIFDAVVEAIRCDPAQAFYTDDIAENVAAGRRHGLDAEVFIDVPTLRDHLKARGVRIHAAA